MHLKLGHAGSVKLLLTRSSSERSGATRRALFRVKGPAGRLRTVTILGDHRIFCSGCGSHISPRKTYCFSCGVATSTERLLDVARQGRIIAVSPEVNARRGVKTRGHNLARWGWAASSQPTWLTNEFYETKVYPLLGNIPRSAISTALGVSKTYAGEIRAGKSMPHPRHWQTLAKLVGVSQDQQEGATDAL